MHETLNARAMVYNNTRSVSPKVWNNIGIIRCHSEEEPASIDIEFHDSSLHHSMSLINQMNHTMAALSDTAVLLACQANEELPR